MQKQRRETWEFNPYAPEFIPSFAVETSVPGVHADERLHSYEVPSYSETHFNRSTTRRDLNYVNPYYASSFSDRNSQNLLGNLRLLSEAPPKCDDLDDILALCSQMRSRGVLTDSEEDFFKEILGHLTWTKKCSRGGSPGCGVGAVETWGLAGHDVENSHKAASFRLNLVIVHFAGSSGSATRLPEDLKIVCSDGDVHASRDIFVTNSGFFYRRCQFGQQSVEVPFCTRHQMTTVKTLLVKGRVAIMVKRVQSLMRLLAILQIRGAFSSEQCDVDETDDRYFAEIFATSLRVWTAPFSPMTCTPLDTIPTLPKLVRCADCRIVFGENMFVAHYNEYHSVLPVQMFCCNYYFRTKYEYVAHKNTDCRRPKPETYCGNISAIPCSTESLGISVNHAVKRPSTNTHSTPIDDRV